MTLEELRAAYEAAQEALDTSVQKASARQAKEDLGEALYEYAKENLDATYTLWYPSYDDELSDDQVLAIFDGKWEKVEGDFDDWLLDSKWDACKYIIDDILGKEDSALLQDTEWFDELRFAIEERDDSFPLKTLAGSTSKLMRYDLEVGFGDCCFQDDDDFEADVKAVAEAVGLDFDGYEAHRDQIAAMLREANGGHLYVIWHDDVEDVVMGICNKEWGNDLAPSTITWENPHLIVLDTLNGSGYASDDPLPITITKPFDREMFRLDAARTGRGYTWTDTTGGVTESAYECKVTVR
jgi:hypothetical protein